MKPFVFDSFALLALFRGEKGYNRVLDILSESPEIYMSVINLGEVYYITRRKQSQSQADLAISSALQLPIAYLDVDFELTYQAAILKSQFKLSFADAFAASLAIKKKAILLTGDPEFKNLSTLKNFKAEFI